MAEANDVPLDALVRATSRVAALRDLDGLIRAIDRWRRTPGCLGDRRRVAAAYVREAARKTRRTLAKVSRAHRTAMILPRSAYADLDRLIRDAAADWPEGLTDDHREGLRWMKAELRRAGRGTSGR